MGLFGSKKTYVASTVQNMAGDENKRPNYLKTTVVGAVLADQEDVADVLQRAYIKGPAMKLRSFFRYAKTHFKDIGLPTAQIGHQIDTGSIDIGKEISADPVIVQTVEVGPADYSYWVEQYILEHAPDEFNTDWSADVNDDTLLITITYADGSIVSFNPTNFDKNKTYIYASYVKNIAVPDGLHIFIYSIGSGNAVLDAISTYSAPTTEPEFFPFIPIRLENKFLSDSYYPEAYAQAKKGFKKAVDGKIDDVIDKLNKSDNLKDMDFVYAVFGVSVNVLEVACRKYLYNFFKQLGSIQATNIQNYDDWKQRVAAFQESLTDWLKWQEDQKTLGSPLYGAPEPIVLAYPTTPSSKLKIESKGSFPNGYNFEISWQSITETNGLGLAKAGAKKGDLWFVTLGDTSITHDISYQNTTLNVLAQNIGEVRLYWQVSSSHWVALDIVGMSHRNYAYGAKYIDISLVDGLADDKESGFIVPLHYPTLTAMSLVDTTQMSTACTFLVFNSYVIKKTGLLGSLFFKIFLIIVIIVIVVYAPQLAPALAHAAAATGAAVGLTGTAALIAGAAINAVAAMVVTSVIMKASIAVFGDKIGLIIGTVVSIVAMNSLTNLVNGQGFVVNFGNMLSATNITQLTSSVGNVYAKFVQLDAMKTNQENQDQIKAFDKESKRISDLYAQNFGYDNGIIDPLQLTDAGQVFVEQAATFLTRTLLTGSDIAEMSMDMLTSFTDVTLSNDLPLSK